MLSFLVVALVAQPLDAQFTAADPRGSGVVVMVRHPASWRPQPFAAPHGVARLATVDGRLEARLWVTDELASFAARGQEQAAASAEFDFVDSGKLLEPFTGGNQILVAGTTYLDGHPARFLELSAPNGARQFLVGRLSGRRGVILAVGASASADFEANRPMLSAIAQSLQVGTSGDDAWPWLLLAAIAAASLLAAALYRHVRRKQSATPNPRPRR